MNQNRERLIWRPNAIPQEEWDAKSRDEQITWWRNNTSTGARITKRSMFDMLDLYEDYEIGRITFNDYLHLICKSANHDEAPRFLAKCPGKIVNALRDKLQEYKGDDPKHWPRTFAMCSYFPWVTKEEAKDLQDHEQQLLWDGISVLKHHLQNS